MPLPLNREWLRVCGVTAWHNAGYTGKHGLSASGECFSPSFFPLEGRIIAPFQAIEGDDDPHAIDACLVHLEFAPDRKIVLLPHATLITEAGYQSPLLDLSLPYILEHNVDTMFISCSTSVDGLALNRRLKEARGFFSCFMSAGNDGAADSNRYISCDYIHGVGACCLDDGVVAASYSSESPDVDLAGPTNVFVRRSSLSSRVRAFGGTSCAAPAVAGMCALVNDFFIEQTGAPLSSANMLRFLKDHARRVDPPASMGAGLPILPRPSDIDVKEYESVSPLRQYLENRRCP